jgi:hypothetical protein
MRIRGIVSAVLLLAFVGYGFDVGANESPAEPAEAPAEEATPADAPTETDVDTRSVGSLRGQLEADMGTLGKLANDARKDENIGRAACVLQREERAKEVMELATGEILILQDGSTTPQQRKFAAEKLAAAADRLHKLVEEAKACRGELAPEDQDDDTKNDMGQTQTIPIADPTAGPPSNQPQLPPPPVDDTRPPSVASPTF